MKLWFALSALLIGCQLTACGGGSAGAAPTATASHNITAQQAASDSATGIQTATALPNDFSEAKAKWQMADIHNYSFAYKEGGGYKFAVYPFVDVKVVNDIVVEIDGKAVGANDVAAQRLSVHQLLNDLEARYTHSKTEAGTFDIVGASYDEILGFPVEIHTGSSQCCDQDHELAIKDFTVNP